MKSIHKLQILEKLSHNKTKIASTQDLHSCYRTIESITAYLFRAFSTLKTSLFDVLVIFFNLIKKYHNCKDFGVFKTWHFVLVKWRGAELINNAAKYGRHARSDCFGLLFSFSSIGPSRRFSFPSRFVLEACHARMRKFSKATSPARANRKDSFLPIWRPCMVEEM